MQPLVKAAFGADAEGGRKGKGGRVSLTHGKEGASGGCGEVGDRDRAHKLNISDPSS